MYKIKGTDGLAYGPASEAQIKEWIAAGRANGQTLAQTEASPDWKPLSDFPEFSEALAARGAKAPPPAPASSSTSSAWAEAAADEILARDYRIEIGSCLSRGWDLVMRHFWLLVGASLVLGLIQGAVPLLTGVCMGGIYWLSLKLIRGERAEFGDAFGGFSLAFLQLFLAGLVSGLLTAAGFAFCILPGIYLAVAWLFCLPLTIDKKLEFWPAMELSRKVVTKHWWVLFGLVLVGALLNLLGLLVCCVGVYVTTPVVIAALAYAYEDIFAGQRPPAA